MKANKTISLMIGFLIIFLSYTSSQAYAANNYCIAVNGGFGKGGTTFVGIGFSQPGSGLCGNWSGIIKTGSTVVLTSSGSACTSSDGKVMTLTMNSTDPLYFGYGEPAVTDHIQVCPKGAANCPYGEYSHGYFSGQAAHINCTSALTTIPSLHD